MCYTAVQINNLVFENNFCNKSSRYENYGQLLLQRKPYDITSPNWHFSLSAKMNGDAGNSMKNTLWYAKGNSWAEATSNSGKI